MKKIMIVLLAVTLSGCAGGRMVCEWETDDDRYTEIVNKVLETVEEKE